MIPVVPERGVDESLGYDFGDKETRLQLELMDDLQKLGVSKYLDLPQVRYRIVDCRSDTNLFQLVVVGDQSTGKSSVLQAVTDIPFQVNDTMCTRFATEIDLRRTSDETTTVDFSIVPSNDEKLERKRALAAWRPGGFDQTATLNKTTMKSIFTQV